jgi:hypothetical protein
LALDAQRIYAGELDCSVVSRFVTIDVRPYSVVSIQAVPRYGASLGSWDASIKRTIAGTPVAFGSAINFTSSTLNRSDIDTNGTDTLVVTNDTAGSSGLVDLYVIGKSD